jgi:hypothetical protein
MRQVVERLKENLVLYPIDDNDNNGQSSSLCINFYNEKNIQINRKQIDSKTNNYDSTESSLARKNTNYANFKVIDVQNDRFNKMNSVKQHAHSKVELKISCENLPYTSTQVILLVKDTQSQSWEQTSYETEVIKSSTNPEFVTGIVVDYFFEVLQQFR